MEIPTSPIPQFEDGKQDPFSPLSSPWILELYSSLDYIPLQVSH